MTDYSPPLQMWIIFSQTVTAASTAVPVTCALHCRYCRETTRNCVQFYVPNKWFNTLTWHLRLRYGCNVIAWFTSSCGRILANRYKVVRHATRRCDEPWLCSSCTRLVSSNLSTFSIRQSTICLHAVSKAFGGSTTVLVESSLSSFGLKSWRERCSVC